MPQGPGFLLKKPTVAGGVPQAWTPEAEQTSHPVGDTILGVSDALRGLIGFGGDSKAGRFGELVGAAIPFVGPAENLMRSTRMVQKTLPEMSNLIRATPAVESEASPAVKALVDMLDKGPETVNPTDIALDQRITGRAYKSSKFSVPEIVPHRPRDPFKPGQIVSQSNKSRGLEFSISPKVEPAKPRSFQEASLYQEGHVPGFGQTAQNLAEAEPWRKFYRQYQKPVRTVEPHRSFAKTATKQADVAPSIKGLEEIGDITTGGKVPESARTPLSSTTRIPAPRKGTTSKLTELQVKAIRQMTGDTREIAKQYGVGEQTIRAIRNRESFNWITDD